MATDTRTVLLVVASVGATFGVACEKAVPVAPPPTEVYVTEVVQKDVPSYLDLVGQTVGYQDVEIRARVEGFIDSVNFQEGSFVRKGALLYRIDPKPFEAAVSGARADQARAQAALEKAENDVARARADVADAEANHQAAVAGPTREERAIADAEVEAAASALAVLERRLNKTILRAPADGVVSVIVAEIGENIHAGQPVLVIAETGKQFLSFNAREDLLHGLTVGTSVNVRRSGAAEKTPALVTELRPLGTFATWQAERAVGDHDRNTLRLRLDLQGDPTGFEPGMSVWLDP